MIKEAAGRCDQNIGAALELSLLVIERHAANQKSHRQLVLRAERFDRLGHLRRKLARRLKDERARHPRPGAALFQHGEQGEDE